MRLQLSRKTILLIRDVLISVGIVGIILATLWGYTGQFPESPMVVVTSGSMMHDDASYGRVGTIDPGDLVLVKKIDDRTDITTRGAASDPTNPDHRTYGDYGDVIIYYPDGDTDRVPIIHRAMCWVEVTTVGSERRYTVAEYDIVMASAITIGELSIENYQPQHGGFITKGDHNSLSDQSQGGVSRAPVKVDWVVGKARGELPWFGLIKLMFFGDGNGYSGPDKVKVGNAVAPEDEWVCLGLSLLVIVGVPTGWDIYQYYRRKKTSSEQF
jgi:signal peptidase